MKTHVIILAQGQQKRLPDLTVAKQMLPLPALGSMPILHRTIRQLYSLLDMRPRSVPSDPIREMITVVCWLPMSEELVRVGVPVAHRLRYHPDTYTLPEPGNSSLKGVAFYLARTAYDREIEGYERTVVLFGDTVYSWACLRAALDPTHWHMAFTGTSDLSTSGGELWAVTWDRAAEAPMMDTLAKAIEKHPPFEAYQPGQMRRWLWETDHLIDGAGKGREPDGRVVTMSEILGRTWYRSIDDYTRDIDLPEHVALLYKISQAAAEDDRANGAPWL